MTTIHESDYFAKNKKNQLMLHKVASIVMHVLHGIHSNAFHRYVFALFLCMLALNKVSANISSRVLLTSSSDGGINLTSFSAFMLSIQSQYKFHYFVCNMQFVHAMHVIIHYSHSRPVKSGRQAVELRETPAEVVSCVLSESCELRPEQFARCKM